VSIAGPSSPSDWSGVERAIARRRPRVVRRGYVPTMAPSSDSAAARRVLLWGLVAIVLLMTAVAGLTAVRRTTGLDRKSVV